MRGRGGLSGLWGLALVLVGCAGAPQYDPWLVPRERFLSEAHTIALSPVGSPQDLDDAGPVEVLFDSLITEALRAAGFSVVPSDIVSDIWSQGADSIGGYYDPMTGEADTSRLNPLRRYFKQRLRDEYGADAVLFPEIAVVDAPFADGTAKWDGTSQSVAGFFTVLLSAIGSNQLPSGTAEGLSLDVQIEGMDRGAVFNNRGGIELWSKPTRDGSQLDRVPRERLFRDRKRNERAVRMALEAVLERGEESSR